MATRLVTQVVLWGLLGISSCADSGATELWPWPSDADLPTSSSSSEGASPTEGENENDSETGEPPRLDIGETGDTDDDDLVEHQPIPSTCAAAAVGESSVGCEFLTVDLDNKDDSVPFAVVVSNVQAQAVAQVSVERRVAGAWSAVAGPVALAPMTLHEFRLPDFHFEGTGKHVGGGYRIRADVPIVAYQFNPIDGADSLLSDASMLYPVASWDSINHVVQWGADSGHSKPFVTIAAAVDGTIATFVPAVDTDSGPGVSSHGAGQPIALELDAGDTISINPVDPSRSLTGSRISSDQPIALFSGHGCANIPADVCCCDHLEDQLAGVRLWGLDFVAAHMPVRDLDRPEPTLWQIYASEHDTVVTLERAGQLFGLPIPAIRLDQGELIELFVTAPPGVEADFRVRANRPIALLGYMVGSHNLPPELHDDGGDPAMVQFPSVEQFLPRYVILVPGTWIHDRLLLTRAAGATVSLDGVLVDDNLFEPVGEGEWEVARVPVTDGVHTLDGDGVGFGVVVIGWDQYDSYAYLGGTGTVRLNPNPEG